MTYIPTSQGDHGREEELQWARIVGKRDAAPGVALIFVQKLCTAFHEFEPAWRNGMLSPGSLPYFRERLAGRARRVLQVLDANKLANMEGVAKLREALPMIEGAESLEVLAMMAELIHAVSHALADALEQASSTSAA